MKLSDDGFSFTLVSCAKTQTGQTAYIVTILRGALNCTHVQVPEWASFCAAISPSGRSLAYTFFEGYQCNIWVLRRQMGSPQMKVDQLQPARGHGASVPHTLTVSQRENVRPQVLHLLPDFGIFEYEAMEEDLDENGEICFNYCRLLRNISLECRKGDCFQHIMLNPAKNEITLQHGHRPQRQRDRPRKLAFEIDATGRIKAKYDGLQGLMMYAPPMVTINPCINTEQGKAWSDEKKAFVMEENGGFYTLDLTDLSAVDGQTNPAADEFLKLLEALDAKFCEFVQQNQAKLKTPSVRIKVDKESGQAFYKYLNMRIRTQTMAGKRKTIPVVDMSNYLITERATIGTGDLVAALVKIDTAYAIPEGKFGLKWSFLAVQQPYDNEASFEPYLNPESMYTAPMQ
eukprot:tig00020939_g16057.t1